MADIPDTPNQDQKSTAKHRELHALCTAVYDHVISDEEMDRLSRLLDESEEARQIYLKYVALHGALHTHMGKSSSLKADSLRRHITVVCSEDIDSAQVKPASLQRLHDDLESRTRRKIRWLTVPAIAASVALFLTACFYLFNQRIDDSSQVAQPLVTQSAARISYLSPSVVWRSEAFAARPNDVIQPGGALALSAGEIELTYDSGTRLILLGPAEFLVHSSGGKLITGGLVASVTEAGHGFTIDTPNGKIVDLGTEFGVAIDDFGVAEVSVFDGIVEAYPRGAGNERKIELTQGRGLQWDRDRLLPVAADGRRFSSSVLGQRGASNPKNDALLVEEFFATTPKPQVWNVLGSAQPTPQGLLLAGDQQEGLQPYLLTTKPFDPAKGAVTVTCDFRAHDSQSDRAVKLAVLTRSSSERGIALPPWKGALASCVRCCFEWSPKTNRAVLRGGVKMESNRELTNIALSEFNSPTDTTAYRMIVRDDGVNISYTVYPRDNPTEAKTVRWRSLFRGSENHVAIESSNSQAVLIERIEVLHERRQSQQASYDDFSNLVRNHIDSTSHDYDLLNTLVPRNGTLILQDDFESNSLDRTIWTTLGEVDVQSGSVRIGAPNAQGRIDTWKPRPYLLTKQTFAPHDGGLAIIGKISFSENFRAGFGASFSVMTRANNVYGKGPEWEQSVLSHGLRTNFWPAAWNDNRRLEIYARPSADRMVLLATNGAQVDPNVFTYLFRMIDNGENTSLTILDPNRPEAPMSIESSSVSLQDQGRIGFESCWGSPVLLDTVSIYKFE